MVADCLVADASVAAKWFLTEDEPDVVPAARLRTVALTKEIELHAPAVFSYEVGHLLLSASRRRPARLEEGRAVERIRDLFSVPVNIHPMSEDDAAAAMAMAIRFSKSFYDMTYLHLAEKLDCKLCTADERAVSSTDPQFPSRRIVSLSELWRV